MSNRPPFRDIISRSVICWQLHRREAAEPKFSAGIAEFRVPAREAARQARVAAIRCACPHAVQALITALS
jgi:hypothetical protein